MKRYVLIIPIALILSMPVFGLSYHWTGAATPDVRWNNVTNWQEGIANGLPKITDPCQFPGFGRAQTIEPLCIIDASHTGTNKAVTVRANIGNEGAGPCTVIVDGGEFEVGTEIWLARNAANNYGILIISNGLVTVPVFTHVGQTGTGELHVAGGVMNNNGNLNIGATVNGVGHFSMTGGMITNVDIFNVGSLGGFGSVLMEGGTLYADTLAMNGNVILTLDESAKLILSGDDTIALEGFTNSDWLVAADGRILVYNYNETVPGHTTITTVPEPAIVVVLCIVGVLGIQRRR